LCRLFTKKRESCLEYVQNGHGYQTSDIVILRGARNCWTHPATITRYVLQMANDGLRKGVEQAVMVWQSRGNTSAIDMPIPRIPQKQQTPLQGLASWLPAQAVLKNRRHLGRKPQGLYFQCIPCILWFLRGIRTGEDKRRRALPLRRHSPVFLCILRVLWKIANINRLGITSRSGPFEKKRAGF